MRARDRGGPSHRRNPDHPMPGEPGCPFSPGDHVVWTYGENEEGVVVGRDRTWIDARGASRIPNQATVPVYWDTGPDAGRTLWSAIVGLRRVEAGRAEAGRPSREYEFFREAYPSWTESYVSCPECATDTVYVKGYDWCPQCKKWAWQAAKKRVRRWKPFWTEEADEMNPLGMSVRDLPRGPEWFWVFQPGEDAVFVRRVPGLWRSRGRVLASRGGSVRVRWLTGPLRGRETRERDVDLAPVE